MPANLLPNLNISSKRLKLTTLLVLSPLFFFAQSLTGLWIGSMSNDSTTIRKDQSLEIALTEYRGKVYGYSRSEFIVDDILYYMVKRVKGTIDGDVCVVTDDEIMSYNFPGKLDKNVKVSSTFRRDKKDSTWQLEGKWQTNATKKYYAISGNLALEQENDLTASKIFPHLEELKLADEVTFYKDRKEGLTIVKIAKPEKIKTEYSISAEELSSPDDITAIVNTTIVQKATPTTIPVKSAINTTTEVITANASKETSTFLKDDNINHEKNSIKESIPVLAKTNSDIIPTPVIEKKEIKSTLLAQTQKSIVSNQPEIVSAKQDSKNIIESTAKINLPVTTPLTEEKKEVKAPIIVKTISKQDIPVTKTPQQVIIKQPDIVSTDKLPGAPNKTMTKSVITKVETKKPDVINASTAKVTTAVSTDIATENKAIVLSPVMSVVKLPTIDVTLKAALIAGRKSDFSQEVNFKSDSLQISLYDNGEIDGDTVSIFMNGEILLSKQLLKATAYKKTIYLTPGKDDEFTLVMFAESLGKYPPNTGLLVIRDGNDIYNLRFSSDFQKNAGIVFKRKK